MVVITEFKSNRVNNNMSDICKNCSTPVSGKYCSNCGQSTATARINFHYIMPNKKCPIGLVDVDVKILEIIPKELHEKKAKEY